MSARVRLSALWLVVIGAGAAWSAGCKRSGHLADEVLQSSAEPVLGGNVEHGQQLVEHFECARCHQGLEPQPRIEKACVTCHQQIADGTFPASATALAKWQPVVHDLRFAPSLEAAGRFRVGWLANYLNKPHDLRPTLVPNMPRLAFAAGDVADIVAFLKDRKGSATVSAIEQKPDLPKGDAERGKALLGTKTCLWCHRMTGGPTMAMGALTIPIAPDKLERGMVLAPDLRFARERLSPAMLAAWIEKPSHLKPNTDMPDVPLTLEEARDIATFLYTAPLEAPVPKALVRLPVLARPVRFDEVNAKVFHRTCWHCHSEPDFAIGDGGPGNSGGLGFRGRGVDLSSFQGLLAGYVTGEGEQHERKSMFAPAADGLPRLLSSLVVRYAEEAGAATGEVRGMPLGMPPLSAEDIQLVESWIAQGRLR